MTCYDCIHCEACSDAGDAGFSCLKEDVSKCKHFKNKADFVKVVKCENCVYFDMKIPYHEEYGTCEKHDFNIFHKSFYCGYAEPHTPQKEG